MFYTMTTDDSESFALSLRGGKEFLEMTWIAIDLCPSDTVFSSYFRVTVFQDFSVYEPLLQLSGCLKPSAQHLPLPATATTDEASPVGEK